MIYRRYRMSTSIQEAARGTQSTWFNPGWQTSRFCEACESHRAHMAKRAMCVPPRYSSAKSGPSRAASDYVIAAAFPVAGRLSMGQSMLKKLRVLGETQTTHVLSTALGRGQPQAASADIEQKTSRGCHYNLCGSAISFRLHLESIGLRRPLPRLGLTGAMSLGAQPAYPISALQ
jgi:hypothetical protein